VEVSTPPPHGLNGRLSECYVTTEAQPAIRSRNKAPIWGLRSDLYYCLTVSGLLIWGALSNERKGLSYTIPAGPRQRSHYVAESHRTHGHILPSQIRDFPLRRLLRLARSRWKYSTPPPNGELTAPTNSFWL
jgi:hypothetical protein